MEKFFNSFFLTLIHPFEAHRYYKGEETKHFRDGEIWRLNLYESVSLSWLFVIINGIARVFIIHTLLTLFVGEGPTFLGFRLWQTDQFSSFYFIVLSIVLDMVFHPLVTLLMVQVWELIIKAYANVLDLDGDWDDIAESIMAVSLSSYFFKIIPFLGDILQSLFSIILMYAGLRERLGADRMLAIVILLTPFWLITFIFIVVSVTFMLFL
jgi:hypothetical protein